MTYLYVSFVGFVFISHSHIQKFSLRLHNKWNAGAKNVMQHSAHIIEIFDQFHFIRVSTYTYKRGNDEGPGQVGTP